VLLVVPDLKIKSLYAQVVIDVVRRYQSDEHDRTELKQKREVPVVLSPLVQHIIVPLGSHTNSSFP